MRSETDLLRGAAAFLTKRGAGEPVAGLVLGSGLKGFGGQVRDALSIAFDEVPGWPVPRVEGHGGSLVVGEVEGARVACLTGRVHLYEGWTPAEVVRALRTLRLLGVPRFLLTNAAGGIAQDLRAGDLMLLRDHVNLTGRSALVGPAEPELGPRFPDQTAVYAPVLREILTRVDPALKQGVYAGMLGPSYETPAEIRYLRTIGADAVGMSTVLEATALAAMGAQVAAVSLISNLAAGISPVPLSHDEVIAAGKHAESRLTALLRGFCRGSS